MRAFIIVLIVVALGTWLAFATVEELIVNMRNTSEVRFHEESNSNLRLHY